MDAEQVREQLRGPIPSLRTPFLENGDVDYDSLRGLIDFLIDAGATSLMLTAGDSHYFALSDDEIAEVTKVTCEQAAGRAMVIAADRYHTTGRAVAFAEFSRDAGAGIVMVLPPHWGRGVTADTLAAHYAAVAEVMPVMLVTNLFIPLGQDLGAATIEKTLDLAPNVLAIKEDVGGSFAQKLAMSHAGRCSMIAGGQKINHMSMLPFGVDGYLSSFMSFRPEVAKSYWQAIDQSDLPAARSIVKDFDVPLFEALMKLPGGFDAGFHGLMELAGVAKRYRRAPYYTLDEDEVDQLAHQLALRGVL